MTATPSARHLRLALTVPSRPRRSEGLEIAREFEAAVAAAGAQPATIGIVDGRIRVGLSHTELAQLATCGRAVKLNLSNLAAHLVPGSWGSTTVAATLLVGRR